MPHSKNSRTRILAAERRTKALELRKEGRTFAAIARELGVSEQRAHRVITAELQRLNARRAEQAAEVTRLELERLDALLVAVWGKAQEGDTQALDRVLAIMARRTRLLGLDAPRRQELTGGGGGPLRFSLEEALAADKELEGWEHERQQPAGGGPGVPGGPQVP